MDSGRRSLLEQVKYVDVDPNKFFQNEINNHPKDKLQFNFLKIRHSLSNVVIEYSGVFHPKTAPPAEQVFFDYLFFDMFAEHIKKAAKKEGVSAGYYLELGYHSSKIPSDTIHITVIFRLKCPFVLHESFRHPGEYRVEVLSPQLFGSGVYARVFSILGTWKNQCFHPSKNIFKRLSHFWHFKK